jgi:dihydropteroate synthase
VNLFDRLGAEFSTGPNGQPTSAIVVAVVNCTPDSFFDGGRYFDERRDSAAVLAHAERMLDEGADWLDVGGESTRPGAGAVDADEEWRRVAPVIEAFGRDAVVCIDTSKAVVAARALAAGAQVINDVTGLADPQMPAVTADAIATVIMHGRGTPTTMDDLTDYRDLVGEVITHLLARVALARSPLVCIDPGIGFAKTTAQSVALLHHTDTLIATGLPVYIGASRKRFIGHTLGIPTAEDRLAGSLGAVAASWQRGARIFRVHDAGPTRHLVDMMAAIASPLVAPGRTP